MSNESYKVRLVTVNSNPAGILTNGRPRTSVVFEVCPEITESQSVTYNNLDLVHMPGTINLFKNSSSKTFNISGIKLISRTREEAGKNLEIINTLRGWTKPYFGKSGTSNNTSNTQIDTKKNNDKNMTQNNNNPSTSVSKLGLPPEVLKFYAYTTGQDGNRKGVNINGVSVVVQQLDIQYPTDVDYIPTDVIHGSQPFPIIMTISMTLLEIHSPTEFLDFSLEDYHSGNLIGF